jgi:hypothetical protein
MVYKLHKEFWKLDRRFRYICGSRRRDDCRRELAGEAERAVADQLIALGYSVRPTSTGSRYDLLVEGCCRVEVKAATWGGRYEWHYHNKADVVILAAKNGRWHFFVLPVAALAGRRNLAVWSENPTDYGGQWADFLEAWSMVKPIVERVQRDVGGQLPLAL